MDVANLSVAMAQNQVASDASLAMINNIMNAQGEQLVEMLAQASPAAPHPTLGHAIDMRQ